MVEEKKPVSENGAEIDLLKLLRSLWKNLWIIIIATAFCGCAVFLYSRLFIKPTYQSSVMMYVNSNNISVGGTSLSISSSSITASRSLVDTYGVIVKSRSTLSQVIDEANLVGADNKKMTYDELNGKISTSSVNNTEIMRITVTDTDPARAMLIANTIADVLPYQISSIVDGTRPNPVDSAILGTKVSPRPVRNGILGALVGAVVAIGALVVLFLLDNLIHDEKDLTDSFNLPLLAVVPDLRASQSKRYGKYKYGRYKTYGSARSSYSDAYRESADNKKA